MVAIINCRMPLSRLSQWSHASQLQWPQCRNGNIGRNQNLGHPELACLPAGKFGMTIQYNLRSCDIAASKFQVIVKKSCYI